MEEKQVLSVKDISQYLGVSESKIRELYKNSKIPFIKIGGKYKFFLPEIQVWLKTSTVSPDSQSTDDSANKRVEEIFSSIN